jgi:hypothetical protein
MTEKRKEPKPPTGRPLALDPFAESGSQTVPAFIARPAGAPVYHGFEVLNDVVLEASLSGRLLISRLNLAMKAMPSLSRPTTAGQDWSGRFLTNPTFKRFLHPKRSDGEFGASPFQML